MSIRVMADNDADISAKQDAALYYFLSGYKKHAIFKDYESEMEVSISNLQATLKAGGAMVYGHHIYCDGTDTLTLPSNSECYIVVRIDMTQPATHEGEFTTVTLLKEENILADGNIYDIPLYKITTGVNSVTETEDIRNIDENKIVFFDEDE